MAFAPTISIGEQVFQLGMTDTVPPGVAALVYLVHDEIKFPERKWKGLLYLPIPDLLKPPSKKPAPFPGIDWLDMAVDGLRHFVRQGWPAAIMCRNGESRSRLVHIAYWIKSAGMGAEEARKYVATKRPEKFINPNFIDGLLAYQTHLNENVCPTDLPYENT